MLLPIWKNPLLSADDKLEAAISEIEKLQCALRHQILVYQVDDQAFDKDTAADRIIARILSDL